MDCEATRKQADIQRLRALLLEGIESPKTTVADTAFFEEVHARIREADEKES